MMDLTCFNWVQLVKKTDMPANAKYLAFYLSTFMNMEHDVAWPSQMRIAHETGLSRSTVVKWLDYLEDNGWLTKRSQARSVKTAGGSQLQNEYHINIPLKVVRQMDSHTKVGCPSDDKRLSVEQAKDVRQPDTNNNINNNKNNKKKPLPKDFGISDRVQRWAKEKGHNHLENHLENFILVATAKGYQYADWDAAFMNAIRNNWAKINTQAEPDPFAGAI